MNENGEKPFVAIWMVAYNQEKLIAQAVESVMMQQTDFDFRLFIGEDHSTDTTAAICHELKEKYPAKITLLLNQENLGANRNALQVYRACFDSGAKYVAMLEGDDYWTDPKKLQIQVDFLERNPEYSLCFHTISILRPDGSLNPDTITRVPDHYQSIETLARQGNYIHTPSVVYRNVLSGFPAEFSKSPMGDYFLYMMVAMHGKIKYLPEVMAVYREGVGIWSSESHYFRYLSTARVHAYLSNYFDEDQVLRTIFAERVLRFISDFISRITADDIESLAVSPHLRTDVFNYFLEQNRQLSARDIAAIPLKSLLPMLTARIKSKFSSK